jgi:hypothetical protein
MTALTKEYFDRQVADLASKKDLVGLATKIDVGQLETNLGDEIAELAQMTAKGFDHVDDQFAEVIKKLDVRDELDHLKLEFQEMKDKLEAALHVKL